MHTALHVQKLYTLEWSSYMRHQHRVFQIWILVQLCLTRTWAECIDSTFRQETY